MMKGRRRKVAPPRPSFGYPFDGVQPLQRCRDAALNDGRLPLVQGDDAELEIPVALPLHKLHVARVLRPPGRLRGEAERVVDFLEESKEVQGNAVLPLESVKFIRKAAPLHYPALLDVRGKLPGVLVRVPEHALDLLWIDGLDLLCQVVVLSASEPSLELRETIHAIERAVAVRVEGHRHAAVRYFVAPSG